MELKKLQKSHLILITIILIGAFLRFYKLDWGQGIFTHPDEYHIVSSVSQLSFPTQMNPHFFSYGTVTIYLIYFTKEFLNFISSFFHTTYYILHTTDLFLIGRFYSALFSTLTIFLIYKISQKIMPTRYALMAAFLTAITPGLIQQAHFLTPESNLIFFLMGSLFFMLKLLEFAKLRYIILASIFLGLGLGVKISGVVFLLPLFLVLIFKLFFQPVRLVIITIISLVTIAITLFIVDPYMFLDFAGFQNSFNYESGVATGRLLVFYTRQFINTTPVLLQLEKIYPYALGPALIILGILGMLGMLFNIFKDKKLASSYLLFAVSFFSLFLPNAFLFAKWTRFLSPTFPFFAIFATFLLFQLTRLSIPRLLSYILHTTYYILPAIWTLAFFSIYLKDDVRTTASRWLESTIPPESQILVEGGNMVDLPLKGDFKRTSLDFYNMEDNPLTLEKITQSLTTTDYFIIQSRRVFANHLRLPNQFPKTVRFYQDLFSGKTGFVEIKQFHSYPTLSLFGQIIEFPDEQAEETWSVFDHPVIRVFQKI